MIKRKIQETPNGQIFVNIPKDIIEELDLKKGNKLDFSIEQNKIVMEKR